MDAITTPKVLSQLTIRDGLYLPLVYIGLKVLVLAYKIVRGRFSPVRRLTGPPNDSFAYGNEKRIRNAPFGAVHEEWMQQYGHTFVFNGVLGSCQLFTSDPRALSFVLSHSDSFVRPSALRRGFGRNLGFGLLAVEHETHKRQRRLMNPSFGPAQVRNLLPVFWNKSNELRDTWLEVLRSSTEETTTINVLAWLSRATLDIIGIAGFDYHFNALKSEEEDELAKAFAGVFQSGHKPSIFQFVKSSIPGASFFPNAREKKLQQNRVIMNRIGRRLVAEKKLALVEESKTGTAAQGRDMLTLCIKSNMLAENEGHHMSDDEVLAQIATFLVAGHETTATATTWALYALAKNKKSQHRLRQELLEAGLGDEPNMTELEKLPYLDAVIRETMRIHPAVTNTVRQATHTETIPVSRSFKDRRGVEHSHISVQEGDMIYIPIAIMNRSREIWGQDAMEFRPERWESVPQESNDLPSVWSHLMSFLSGPHSCIGFRFALVEMKALLYSLVLAMEFDIDPDFVVDAQDGVVTRPFIRSQPEKGNQMPLICRPVLAI